MSLADVAGLILAVVAIVSAMAAGLAWLVRRQDDSEARLTAQLERMRQNFNAAITRIEEGCRRCWEPPGRR